MPRWLKSLLLVLAIGWSVVVYAPYLRGIGPGSGGFLGGDLSVLVQASGGPEASRFQAEPVPLQDMGAPAYLAAGGERGSILTGASLALSRRLWGVSESSATLYRLENLLLLLAAGLGLANFIRRLLIPWTGVDHARAAARALPIVLFMHPFAVHAVADLSGRSDLLYLALGSWAAASYLRARQDRKPAGLITALVLFVAAHLAGRFGLGLATAIAAAEFASQQRYQPKRLRWKRASTTWLVLAALATAELFVRSALGGSPEALVPFLPGAGSFFERFGILLLPVPTPGLTMALGIVLFLGAIQPAMSAARFAPRLWGRLLGTWFAALSLTLYFGGPAPGGHVGLGDFTRISTLFPSAVVFAAGLAVVSTGLQGALRLFLPIALTVGFGLLSLSQAPLHMRAARATAKLRVELERAEAEAGRLQVELGREGTALLVLRYPDELEEVDPFPDGIGYLLDASLTGRAPLDGVQRPRLLGTDAFVALAREPEFKELRQAGAVVIAKQELFTLGVPAEFQVPPLWRGAASSPDLDLDPLTVGALFVTVSKERLASPKPLPERFAFDANGAAEQESEGGRWVTYRGRTEGAFDLSSDLYWLLAGRVTRAWFDTGLTRLQSASFQPILTKATMKLEPELVGRDWRFAVPSSAVEIQPLKAPETDEYVLIQLDLESLQLRRFVALRHQSGVLLFQDANRGFTARKEREVAWTLERQLDGRTIWRYRGRFGQP